MQKVSTIKKSFHIKELTQVQPLTDNQALAMSEWFSGNHIGLLGCAGTGKTFLAMFLALHSILSAGEGQIVLMRSSVAVRNQGFIPGDLAEKEAVLEMPYHMMCDQLFPYTRCYENLKKGGYIQFCSTSYTRGITLDNAIVIIDEIQSLNAHELDTCLTRLGDNSKLILCGDGIQSDLRGNERNGFHSIVKILKDVPNFSFINFTIEDIVRSNFVKDYIIAREKHGLEC